jgi:thermostable 8-oxoguanine DNA glycosylase
MKNLYKNISELLDAELTVEEDGDTQMLINELEGAAERGFLTKDEFMKICMWKSSRPKNWYLKNSDKTIEETTAKVFDTQYEKRRMQLLTKLNGIRIPTASAILTLTNPQDYGVIDIRVWEVLYQYGSVNVNPTGTNFSFENWYNYLMKLRYFAEKHGVKARDVERTIFEHDYTIHKGPLYPAITGKKQ